MATLSYSAKFLLIYVYLVCGVVSCSRPSENHRELNARLMESVRNWDVESAQRLLRKGADLRGGARDEWTPLVVAANNGDIRMVKMLLKFGPDAADKNNATFWAAAGGIAIIVSSKEALSASPYNISPSSSGAPSIPEASIEDPSSSNTSIVRLLLENGVAVDARRYDGATPLICAAAHGRVGAVKLLLEKGAGLEASDNYGMTPLLAAAFENAVIDMPDTFETVRLLLGKGANIHVSNKDGNTVLMGAARKGNIRNMKLLLDYGADARARNDKGETAMTFAERPEVVSLLMKALVKQQHRNLKSN
jgi:uncharacterized protein